MCGFAAVVGIGEAPVSESILGPLNRILRHRGPDDEGQYCDGHVGMAFRRLAILDLSPAGHQPMVSDDGSLVLVFNGEIYNYIELRERLESAGHQFMSRSDTEVLLHAYQEWGTDCVHRFNGMWAFVLYDRVQRKVVVSRDRFGVKPLFIHRSDSHIVLASEIKAVVASGFWRDGIDKDVVARYLVLGDLDTGNDTFYKGIERVPPGHVLEFAHDGREVRRRFWAVDEAAAPVESLPDDPPSVFRDLLESAVAVRMRSDVPLGVFLSGGLDSTSILCLMSRLRQAEAGPLVAFSYRSDEHNEDAYIADTVRATGVDLRQLSVGPLDLWETVRSMMWFQDEPVNSPTPAVGFELMRMASRQGVKVILNGQGADETLAGYHSYFPTYWESLIAAGHVSQAWKQIGEYSRVLGGSPLTRFRAAVQAVTKSKLSAFPGYGRLASRQHRSRTLASGLFDHEVLRRVDRPDPNSGAGLAAALKDSIQRKPLPLYLRMEDRNSMAHSVEARLPFMDYRLSELSWNLPVRWRLDGAMNKVILRTAMEGIIPESVRTRADKMGFPTSGQRWIAGEWHEAIRDLLTGRDGDDVGFSTPSMCDLLARHRRGETDGSRVLFRAVQCIMWLRHVRDLNSGAAEAARS